MNVLPRFAFLFQNLPIFIPQNIFVKWDKLLSTFIWGRRKARVKLKTIKKKKLSGGLALPNLSNYYIAAQIKAILAWINNNHTAKWRTMEISQMEKPLNELILTKVTNRAVGAINNICIKNTIRAWVKVTRTKQLQKDYLRDIATDRDFKPSRIDDSFKIWADKGLIRFSQMITNKGVDTFENLSKIFHLPNSQFYKYLQVRSYLIKTMGHNKTLNDLPFN